jgi:hypothetical protein
MGVVPIIGLNKSIQRFIPEADGDKSSLELLVEISIQLILMFCGIIIIHRMIVYFPTYSGFKYDNLNLTNVILAFLVIVLSIQTKLGLKVNILVDRLDELWNGSETAKQNARGDVRVKQPMVTRHAPSQADYLDNSTAQSGVFPPAPVSTNHAHGDNYDFMTRSGNGMPEYAQPMGPVAANGLLGGAFGSMF